MANRVIQYLYSIKGKAIYYRGDNKGQDNRKINKSKA